jgi:hypothetical protein
VHEYQAYEYLTPEALDHVPTAAVSVFPTLCVPVTVGATRAGISALLDSVPLAVSFAEARREPIEDHNEEPLELEPLEGDEGL